MTKTVRIENADNRNYKVIVEVWNKGVGDNDDVMISSTELNYPTAMKEMMIHSTQYLVVRENGFNST